MFRVRVRIRVRVNVFFVVFLLVFNSISSRPGLEIQINGSLRY